MRMLITTMALLMFGSVATAQTGTGTQTNPAASPPPAREAPVGHRQPRGGQLPPEKNPSNPNDVANREDAALARKMSICRGC